MPKKSNPITIRDELEVESSNINRIVSLLICHIDRFSKSKIRSIAYASWWTEKFLMRDIYTEIKYVLYVFIYDHVEGMISRK